MASSNEYIQATVDNVKPKGKALSKQKGKAKPKQNAKPKSNLQKSVHPPEDAKFANEYSYPTYELKSILEKRIRYYQMLNDIIRKKIASIPSQQEHYDRIFVQWKLSLNAPNNRQVDLFSVADNLKQVENQDNPTAMDLSDLGSKSSFSDYSEYDHKLDDELICSLRNQLESIKQENSNLLTQSYGSSHRGGRKKYSFNDFICKRLNAVSQLENYKKKGNGHCSQLTSSAELFQKSDGKMIMEDQQLVSMSDEDNPSTSSPSSSFNPSSLTSVLHSNSNSNGQSAPDLEELSDANPTAGFVNPQFHSHSSEFAFETHLEGIDAYTKTKPSIDEMEVENNFSLFSGMNSSSDLGMSRFMSVSSLSSLSEGDSWSSSSSSPQLPPIVVNQSPNGILDSALDYHFQPSSFSPQASYNSGLQSPVFSPNISSSNMGLTVTSQPSAVTSHPIRSSESDSDWVSKQDKLDTKTLNDKALTSSELIKEIEDLHRFCENELRDRITYNSKTLLSYLDIYCTLEKEFKELESQCTIMKQEKSDLSRLECHSLVDKAQPIKEWTVESVTEVLTRLTNRRFDIRKMQAVERYMDFFDFTLLSPETSNDAHHGRSNETTKSSESTSEPMIELENFKKNIGLVLDKFKEVTASTSKNIRFLRQAIDNLESEIKELRVKLASQKQKNDRIAESSDGDVKMRAEKPQKQVSKQALRKVSKPCPEEKEKQESLTSRKSTSRKRKSSEMDSSEEDEATQYDSFDASDASNLSNAPNLSKASNSPNASNLSNSHSHDNPQSYLPSYSHALNNEQQKKHKAFHKPPGGKSFFVKKFPT